VLLAVLVYFFVFVLYTQRHMLHDFATRGETQNGGVTVSSDEKSTVVQYSTGWYSTVVQKRETIKNNNGGDFLLLLVCDY